MSGKTRLTENLEAPQNMKEFSKEWARCIIVDYLTRTDPEWLLANVLKVMDVRPKENPHPGMYWLSKAYFPAVPSVPLGVPSVPWGSVVVRSGL